MDRIANLKKLLVFLGIFAVSLPVLAGNRGQPADETFPESRFGQPPARVNTGVFSGYAVRAIEVDEADEEGGRAFGRSFGGRGPASTDSVTRSAAAAEHLKASEALPPASEFRKGVQEVALIASDLGFFPKAVFVSRDVPVRMYVTGASKNTLCLMMDSFQVRKQVRSQKIEEITFTPNVPGKYRFYCPVNGMEGTLIVKEFATSGAGAEGEDSAQR